MANKRSNITTLGQIQADTQDAYLSAPLLTSGTGYNAITVTDLSGNKRQMKDPAQTLRPAMGIERISIKSIKTVDNEKGPNGELVFEPMQGDDRIRFVGGVWVNSSSTSGSIVYGNAVDSYVEITFYGTGLNWLSYPNEQAGTDVRAAVDNPTVGAGEGSDLAIVQNTVIGDRNYTANVIIPVTSGLALGVHTVRLRLAVLANALNVMGFEILNEASTIAIPKGEIISSGKKEVVGTATTTTYGTVSADFDGSPTLLGRGGRVIVYSKDGRIGKVLQQTDASQANMSSANHANEEVISKINWREFGVNRAGADDFSTLSGAGSSRAYTLDNGTTTLQGVDVNDGGTNSVGTSTATTGFYTITFVGTGLDLLINAAAGLSASQTITVDGIPILTSTQINVTKSGVQVLKIVSGLPYGTHTVKFLKTIANGAWDLRTRDFIIYGPKKPSIPDGAIEIGEYYLMSTFVPNTTAGVDTISTGVLRKTSTREFVYVDGTGGTVAWNQSFNPLALPGGWEANTDKLNAYFEYTFFGTGFELRFGSSANRSSNIQVSLQSLSTGGSLQNMTTTNFPSITGNTSVYGTGIAFNSGTGILDQADAASTSGAGFRTSGLPLGLYKVKFNNGTGSSYIVHETLDIITPIHYPDTKRGSLALKPSASFAKHTEFGGVDLSKAKAWIYYDAGNGSIVGSYNIAGVISTATGFFNIFFEKSFKSVNYSMAGMSYANSGENLLPPQVAGQQGNYAVNSVVVKTVNTAGSPVNRLFYLVFFGELANEGDE